MMKDINNNMDGWMDGWVQEKMGTVHNAIS